MSVEGQAALLLERARGGDRVALQELIGRNRARLERTVEARLGSGLRAKVRSSDILQSTYVDVLQSLERFQGTTDEDFANWLVRVLENNIKDESKYYRAEKRDRGREAGEDAREPAARQPSPSTEAAWTEEMLLIGRAMQRLPEDYLRVLCLHMRPGQDHRRTAEQLGRSEGASRVLLARARAALLVELERQRAAGHGA